MNKTQIGIVLITLFSSISVFFLTSKISSIYTTFASGSLDYYLLSEKERVSLNNLCNSPAAICSHHLSLTIPDLLVYFVFLTILIFETIIIGGGIVLLRRSKKFSYSPFKLLWSKAIIIFDILILLTCIVLFTVVFLFGL